MEQQAAPTTAGAPTEMPFISLVSSIPLSSGVGDSLYTFHIASSADLRGLAVCCSDNLIRLFDRTTMQPIGTPWKMATPRSILRS